jgi:hypothetical protein
MIDENANTESMGLSEAWAEMKRFLNHLIEETAGVPASEDQSGHRSEGAGILGRNGLRQ